MVGSLNKPAVEPLKGNTSITGKRLNLQQPDWERYDPRFNTGHLVLGYDTVPSTMDVAWDCAAAGARSGLCIVADQQTQGRGRFRRRWHSGDSESFLLSILLHIDQEYIPFLSIACSLACVESITKLTGVRPRLKWPNDVLWDGKKLAGVLVEARVTEDHLATSVIGLGVNLQVSPRMMTEDGIHASSLDQMGAGLISPRSMLEGFLSAFDPFLADLIKGRDLIGAWKKELSTLGQNITVYQQHGVVKGVAEDVDSTGRLVVRTSSGRTRVVSEGEVTLTPSND